MLNLLPNKQTLFFSQILVKTKHKYIMENIISNISRVFTLRNLITDISVFLCIYWIPALSHIMPFPLYMLEPMRLFMLIGYSLSRNNVNGYFLALSIPIFSALVSGHPAFFKAVLISFELFFNLLVFIQLLKATKLNIAVLMIISILISKVFYYILKHVFLLSGLIDGGLFGISIWIQISSATYITLVFYALSYKLRKSANI